MNRNRLLLCIVCMTMAVPGLAARQEVNQIEPASMDGLVRIQIVRGELEVIGWEKPSVQVTGMLDERMEEFIFNADGGATRIEVKLPRVHRGGSEGSDLRVYIPSRSRLNISGVATDVSARGVDGSIEVGVVSGDIELKGGTDRVILQTVNGDIDIRDSSGRIRVKTVSGDIESYNTEGDSRYGSVSGDLLVENGGSDLDLESVSGNVEVERTRFSRINGHSVSGDIRINGGLMQGGSLEFDNVSGSIRVELGGEIDARFDLESGSGSIRNRLTDDKPESSKYIRDKTLRFSVGDGSGVVILNTRSGDISISK